MEAVRKFLARKNIVFSARRYFIDAMGAMAQGLFCTLLVGTILNTIGPASQQTGNCCSGKYTSHIHYTISRGSIFS